MNESQPGAARAGHTHTHTHITSVSTSTGSWADFLSWVAQSKPAPPSRRPPSPSSTTSSSPSSPCPLPPSDLQQLASRKEAQVFWRRTQPWLETAKAIQDQARRVFWIKVGRSRRGEESEGEEGRARGRKEKERG